MLSASAGVTLV